MKRALPSNTQLLAFGLIAITLGGVLLGTVRPLGARSWDSLRGWWTMRRFHQAEADQDLPALLDLGKEYLHLTGEGDVLEFAIYRVGYGASGPSTNRLPSDALFWAQAGIRALDESLELLPDPWAVLQIQCYTLVERVFPLTQKPDDLLTGLQAMQDRLAAGGGLTTASPGLSRLYRSYLALPPAARQPFLLSRLERRFIPEDG